jgi:hypothetical protein
MDHGVRAAVLEAYRVFSRYSFGASGPSPSDPGALGPLEERLLRLTPPREIPPELLAAHAECLAVTIEGAAADDFRALLPRYFELIAADCGPVKGWKQEALRGLARCEYRTQWPAEEAATIDRLLTLLFAAAEARGAADHAADIRRFMDVANTDAAAPG